MTRLAVFVVTFLAATMARAEPLRVDLARCTAFDARALAKAIARELPANSGTSPFAVIVACPDLVTANLHVEPVPADGPIARSLDLGEVPGDLRVKLLALAIAELAEAAATARLPAGATGPTKPRGDAADPQALSDVDPRPRAATSAPPAPAMQTTPNAATITPPRAPPARTAANAPTIAPTRVATIAPPSEPAIVDGRAAPSSELVELGPIAGVRVFASTRTMLAELGAELRLPWLRVGVRGGAGSDHDTLGSVHPWLATATLARELACIDAGCVLVRGEAGMAGVVAHAVPLATSTNASAAYAQASLGIELHHRFDSWTATATLEGGYARGLVAKAGLHDISSLAGAVGAATIGARWR